MDTTKEAYARASATADRIDLDRIENWFTYHPPQGNQQQRYELLRAMARELSVAIVKLVPSGADRTVALLKLRECVMTANAGIACDEGDEMTTRPFSVPIKRALRL